MWFKLPDGVGGISVAGQEFGPEFTDKAGVAYFRAPDHFAPAILGETGFAALTTAPEGTDLPDLPQADPERDTTIVGLQTRADAMEMERDALRTENVALKLEVEGLKKKLADAEAKDKK
jgi:hypothetical protein